MERNLMNKMGIDIAGRLNKIKLGRTKALYPLFEAIINAIDAIRESKRADGKIIIQVERSPQKYFKDIPEKFIPPVISFKIQDNGIGFTQENFHSFLTADSTWKIKIGGKGIGRFVWLKTFQKILIDSNYRENGLLCHREFSFSKEGVSGGEPISIKDSTEDTGTTIRLSNYETEYQEECPKSLITIAKKIIEHCLIYFHSGEIPKAIIKDDDEEICLNDFYHKELKNETEMREFRVNGSLFKYSSLRLYNSTGTDSEHKVVYCANKREVKSISLDKLIADISSKHKLSDLEGKKFTYLGYVSGQYLDECVNVERTDFNFFQEENLYSDSVTFDSINEQLQNLVEEYLNDNLRQLRDEKYKKYETYILEKAPEYRILLKLAKKDIESLPAGLSEEKLSSELYKIKSKKIASIRETGKKLMDNAIWIDKLNLYKEEYLKFIEQENEIGKSSLAEYVVHRRILLNILEQNLNRQEDGKYCKEEQIHQIIFPLGVNSYEIDYEDHNLWIIDERLAYHSYLTSNKSLGRKKEEGGKRPDIVIYTENKYTALHRSITIIEFKRPGSSYNELIDQATEYILLIRSGKARDDKGRQIKVEGTTAFFAYLVCDLMPEIEELAKGRGFKKTPDSLGYFFYNENYNAYYEIISFEKLLEDALKRNRMLFDKLNLPKDIM